MKRSLPLEFIAWNFPARASLSFSTRLGGCRLPAAGSIPALANSGRATTRRPRCGRAPGHRAAPSFRRTSMERGVGIRGRAFSFGPTKPRPADPPRRHSGRGRDSTGGRGSRGVLTGPFMSATVADAPNRGAAANSRDSRKKPMVAWLAGSCENAAEPFAIWVSRDPPPRFVMRNKITRCEKSCCEPCPARLNFPLRSRLPRRADPTRKEH